MYPYPPPPSPPPPQNDRLMAAACHLSSLVGFGLVAPLAIYLTQRERSGFVARHALQALFLQVSHLLLTVAVVVLGLIVLVATLHISVTMSNLSRQLEALSVGMALLLLAGLAVPSLLYVLAMVFGVIEGMQGKEAGLPLFGALARSIHRD